MGIDASQSYQKLVEAITSKLLIGVKSHIELILTTRCNLRCTYCFERGTDRFSDMSIEIGKASLDQFLRTDLPIRQNLVLFGGEPFLRWELFKELVEHARSVEKNPDKLNISTVTNATCIPPAAPEFLARNNVLAMVSLDLGAEAHNRNRITPKGYGTHESTILGIKALIASGVKVVVRSTIIPEGIDCLEETYHRCRNLGASAWYLSRVTGFSAWDKSEAERLEKALDTLSLKHYAEESVGESSMEVKQFDYMSRGHILDSCNAGTWAVAVNPEGRLYGCSRLATTSQQGGTFPLGHIRNGGVDMSQLGILRSAIETAGCAAINFEETGNPFNCSSEEKLVRDSLGSLQGRIQTRRKKILDL